MSYVGLFIFSIAFGFYTSSIPIAFMTFGGGIIAITVLDWILESVRIGR